MCGIAGYAGRRPALPVVLDSLHRLEYRGYDSAGVAVVSGSRLRVYKAPGSIEALERSIPRLRATVALGHTRWATHGPPNKANAHPHVDCRGQVAVVHNGIIENHRSLQEELEERGHRFTSETDTEVVPHLLEEHLERGLPEALRRVLPRLQGSYALAVLWAREPATLAVARRDSPLVVGLGRRENLMASDAPALLKRTRRVAYLENGQMALLTPERVRLFTASGKILNLRVEEVPWKVEDAERAGYPHHMLKEIHEQPRALRETLSGRIDELGGRAVLPEAALDFSRIERVLLVACGSSYHAALFGSTLLERLGQVPAEARVASELRYAEGVLGPDVLTVAVSQSGETADTLAALREAAGRGRPTLAVTNVAGSRLAREADASLTTRAGPEVGVAATKTFLTQMAALALLSLHAGQGRGTLSTADTRGALVALRELAVRVQSVLDGGPEIGRLAVRLSRRPLFFYLGRGLGYPVALEGALKLKEVAYIPAEGFPAGELKHGPLALVGERTPVIALALPGPAYAKMLSNLREVKARGAPVVALALEGDAEAEACADEVLTLPPSPELTAPFLAAVALQLFAYHAARARGCPIDKPRHLAKSVTVE